MKKCLSVLLVLLLACTLSACSLLPQEESRRVSPVVNAGEKEQFEYAYATVGDIEYNKTYSCKYMPVQKVSLCFEAAGEYMDEMYVSQGDAVTEGQLLAQLKLDNVTEQLEQCRDAIVRAELAVKQLEENRALALKKQEILYTGEELESAKAQVNASYDSRVQEYTDKLSVYRLKEETLNENLEAHRIYSPMDGSVTYARQVSDTHISALDEVIFTIADAENSVFSVTTEAWQYLPAGLTVTITCNKVEYEAVVTDEADLGLPSQEKTEGQSATVYLALTTPAPELEDSDRGSFTVLIDARRDVLRISEDAVSRAGDDYIVYYETEEGIRSYKTVVLGFHADGMYEVISGLEEGEAVIVS